MPDDDRVQLYIRVPVDVAERIRRVAEANDRSVSAEVARLVREYVAEFDELEARRVA